MFAKALEANGAAKVYIIGRNWQKLEAAAAQSVANNVESVSRPLLTFIRNMDELCLYLAM
jgi:hypothetical protein